MKTITQPVIVGKDEILHKSVDNEFELYDDRIIIKQRYKYSEPKDSNDEYSVKQERLCDFHQIMLKRFISSIHWMWDKVDEVYIIDITADGKGIAWNMSSKAEAISMYDELINWWLQ